MVGCGEANDVMAVIEPAHQTIKPSSERHRNAVGLEARRNAAIEKKVVAIALLVLLDFFINIFPCSFRFLLLHAPWNRGGYIRLMDHQEMLPSV